MKRSWARRTVELHDELAAIADDDPRWWLLAGSAAVAEPWPARPGYVVSDAEPSADTFIGYRAAPAPGIDHTRDLLRDAIDRARAARTALRELDGTLPDQPLAVTLARDDRTITRARSTLPRSRSAPPAWSPRSTIRPCRTSSPPSSAAMRRPRGMAPRRLSASRSAMIRSRPPATAIAARGGGAAVPGSASDAPASSRRSRPATWLSTATATPASPAASTPWSPRRARPPIGLRG